MSILENALLVDTAYGRMFYLAKDLYIGRSLEKYGEWAQLEIDVLLSYLPIGGFAIDVGANIGFHTVSFASKVGAKGRVWAFEPDNVNSQLLNMNMVSCGASDNTAIFSMALSKSAGLAHISRRNPAVAANFGDIHLDEDSSVECAQMALDDLRPVRPIDLIKIDVEGREADVLLGAMETIRAHLPVISLEASTGSQKKTLETLLADLGYETYEFKTNAFNPRNFRGNAEDIWDGEGHSANIIAIIPERHPAPRGLVRRHLAASEAVPSQLPALQSSPVLLQYDLDMLGATVRDFASEVKKLGSPLLDNSEARELHALASKFLEGHSGSVGVERLGSLFAKTLEWIGASIQLQIQLGAAAAEAEAWRLKAAEAAEVGPLRQRLVDRERESARLSEVMTEHKRSCDERLVNRERQLARLNTILAEQKRYREAEMVAFEADLVKRLAKQVPPVIAAAAPSGDLDHLLEIIAKHLRTALADLAQTKESEKTLQARLLTQAAALRVLRMGSVRGATDAAS